MVSPIPSYKQRHWCRGLIVDFVLGGLPPNFGREGYAANDKDLPNGKFGLLGGAACGGAWFVTSGNGRLSSSEDK